MHLLNHPFVKFINFENPEYISDFKNRKNFFNPLFDSLFNPLCDAVDLHNRFASTEEITTEEDKVLVKIAMPGIKKEDINLHFEKDVLTIKTKEKDLYSEEETVLHSEFEVNALEKSYQLANNIDIEKIDAKLDNGILTLTLPFKEDSKPKKIEVA